jgi:hypothetical protein
MTRARADDRWLTPGVGAVGAASFFSDSGHEITTALLPTFLTSTLHGSAAALGVIDGFSDALVGVMQLVGGPLANDPHKRARTASGGYLGTAVATGPSGWRPRCGRQGCCARWHGCRVDCAHPRGTLSWRPSPRPRPTAEHSAWSGQATTWAR